MVKNGNVNSFLVSRVIWNIIIIFNFSLKLSRTFSLEEGEGLGEVARSRGGCGNLAWVSGLPKGLGERRFSSFPFFPQKRLRTQASGNLTEARGIEHYGLSGLNKSFFVCFFFLALQICGFVLPGFIGSCRVSTSAFHSTNIQTRSTIPNHILSVNIFHNEYLTIILRGRVEYE